MHGLYQSIALNVDLMLPDLLLRPRRVVTDTEQVAHLLHAGEQDLSRHEESDPLGTWGRGETSYSSAMPTTKSSDPPRYVQNSENLFTSLTACMGLLYVSTVVLRSR